MKRKILIPLLILFAVPTTAFAMHIAEGYLPPMWAAIYFVLCVPFVFLGVRDIKKKALKNKEIKMLLGLVAAYCFVLSALKLPSVTGSSSHPTGTGFGAMLFGPFTMTVVGLVVLLFQALFLAHGGITTLGANTFSMAVVGPIVAYGVYKLFKNKNKTLAVFLSAALGDLVTYVVTALQLAFAFPAKNGGVLASAVKFLTVFAVTQVPLAIVEGLLTVVIFNYIEKNAHDELLVLGEEI